jgi:WD40 repeat protein
MGIFRHVCSITDQINAAVIAQSPVTSLSIFDGDEAFLSTSRDRAMCVWDVRRGARLSVHTQRMGAMNGAVIGRDQVQVASVGKCKTISFWDLREPNPLQVGNVWYFTSIVYYYSVLIREYLYLI